MSCLFLASLIYRPYFSPVAVLLAGVVLLSIALFSAWQTRGGRTSVWLLVLVMRVVLIAVLTGLLMGPSVLPASDDISIRPTLTILLDTSGSMQSDDMPDGSRYDFALAHWLDDEQIARLETLVDIDLIAIDSQVRPMNRAVLSASAEEGAIARQSNLADGFLQSLAALPASSEGSSVLILSDGHDSEDRSFQPAAQYASKRNIPIYTVTLGGSSLVRDLALWAQPRQPYLLAGESGVIDVRVFQSNAHEAQTTLHLEIDGRDETFPIRFEGEREVNLALPIQQDEAGVYEYALWVDPLSAELEEVNNHQQVFVDVTAARFSVLMIEGQPYWDTKFLAQALRKDDRIELTQITQISRDSQEIVVTRADPDQARVPESLEDFASYDVVILGKQVEHVLSPEVAAMLVAYVEERGGCLVFSRGQPYGTASLEGGRVRDALSALEPVVWGRGSITQQTMALSPAGHSHPALAFLSPPGLDQPGVNARLPMIEHAPVVEREKNATLTLATLGQGGTSGGGQPFIVTMPYPSGQVVAVLGQGLWRWNLMARRNPDVLGLYDRFWSNMIRWLVMGSDYTPGQDVSLRLSSRGVQRGDEVRAQVVSRSPATIEASRLELIGPDGSTRAVAMQTLASSQHPVGLVLAEQPGVYGVRLISDQSLHEPIEAKFTVYDVDLERLESGADPRAMRLLAEQSGGQVLDPYKPEELHAVLDQALATMTVPPTPRYVWNRGVFLFLILLFAGIEWISRKKGGML